MQRVAEDGAGHEARGGAGGGVVGSASEGAGSHGGGERSGLGTESVDLGFVSR